MTDKRFYRERKSFLCIDGSKIIPFEQVNDDYCDCEDGSDEPGKNANVSVKSTLCLFLVTQFTKSSLSDEDINDGQHCKSDKLTLTHLKQTLSHSDSIIVRLLLPSPMKQGHK